MKKQTNQFLYLLLAVFAILSITACDITETETCGNIDLLFDEVRYEVNTCEDMNFRNGCDYTIDFLNLCYEEGGAEYCREVSLAFVSLLNEGVYTIAHPEVLSQLTPGGNYITGYIGEIAEGERLQPLQYMESGLLTITEVDIYTGAVTGSFEFKVRLGDEGAEPLNASGTFQSVRW